jgi:hypothetical protein
MTSRILALVALASLVACDSGSEPPGGGADETPITQRTSRGTYQCTQERGRTDHTPRSWDINAPALATTSKGAFLVRTESMGSGPFMQPPPDLLLSSFDVPGTFGPASKLPLIDPESAGGLAAAPRGDGFAVVWVDGGKLRFAAFDASGQEVVAPRDVLDGFDRLANPMLTAGPEGLGLVYAALVGAENTGIREVRFALLDSMGAVHSPPRALSRPGDTFTHPAPAITASATGFAMAWRDPASKTGGIDFAAVDVNGVEVVARRRISPATAPGVVAGGLAGFEPPTTALLSIGDGYLAAWAETQRGAGDSGASSVVKVVRLDGAGRGQGAPVAMRAATKDIDEVEPTLVRFGDAVAVLWGRGSHIYICGGCQPDNSIDLVLIDPATLTPVSNQLSLTNGGDPRAGGLLRRRVVRLGESLLTTYLLNFHVHATPGSAAFRCTKP